MTRKTITELTAQANASFPDNATGAITPALLRQFCLDFLDTMRPTYGVISIDETPTSKAATTTYSTFVWETIDEADAPDWSASLASGTIQRNNGPATARVNFTMDCQAPNNTIVTFALFVNGVITPWAISNTSTSATDVQSFALSAIVYSPEANIQYQVQIRTSVNGNVQLSNGNFTVENVPINSL